MGGSLVSLRKVPSAGAELIWAASNLQLDADTALAKQQQLQPGSQKESRWRHGTMTTTSAAPRTVCPRSEGKMGRGGGLLGAQPERTKAYACVYILFPILPIKSLPIFEFPPD